MDIFDTLGSKHDGPEDDVSRAREVERLKAKRLHGDALFNADPNCDHDIHEMGLGGGGVKCRRCPGWFCY